MTANQIRPILERLDINDKQHGEIREEVEAIKTLAQEINNKIGPIIAERDHIFWLQSKTKNFFLNIGVLATFIVSATIIFKAVQWVLRAGNAMVMKFQG